MRRAALLFLTLLGSLAAAAQAPLPDSARLRIFLDCGAEDCPRDYLVTELSAFNLVRDRFLADVQVLVIRQDIPTGGSRYTVSAIGAGPYAGRADTTFLETKPADVEATIREGLLRAVRRALLPIVLASPMRGAVVDVQFPARESAAPAARADPWNLWVFTPGISGTVDAESARTSMLIYNYLNVNRTSPESKVTAEAWYEYNFNRFTNDGVDVRVPVLHTGAWGYWAKSLGERWSLGLFARGERDRFMNYARSLRAAPVAEYNLYPHAENTRRQARIGYGAGLWDLRYFDTTVYDRLRETRPFHQLYIAAVYAQPWGSVNGALVARSFLDNFSQHRLTARLAVQLRLVEGLRLTLEGSGAYVADQISLLKRPPSEEELLLGATQLPTRVLLSTTLGFAYTFGSANAGIVNVRFAGIEEE